MGDIHGKQKQSEPASRVCGDSEKVNSVATGSQELTNKERVALVEIQLADALRNRPGFMAKMVKRIDEGLDAQKRQFDMMEKKWIIEPDFKERREMLKLALAYVEGLPAQVNVNLNAGGKGADVPRLKDVLKHSPQARRALESLLALDEKRVHKSGPENGG